MNEYQNWVEFFKERNEDQVRSQRRARGEISLDDPNAARQLLTAIGKPPKGAAPHG